MNEFEPTPPAIHYAEIHRDPVAGGLSFVEASPVDNGLYATETGHHSMLDELRGMYQGQLPPEYLHADGFNTDTIAAKGMIEQTSEGPVFRINHFRQREGRTDKALLQEVRAALGEQGIANVLFDPEEYVQPETDHGSREIAPVSVKANVQQLPDDTIPEQIFRDGVDSGIVTGLQYTEDESGQKYGTLDTIQAHAITHQPALEAAGFNAHGFAPQNRSVLFTEAGEPVMGGMRYVVDDRNQLFKVQLISSRGVNQERKLEVLQTAARALYDELGLDASYRQEFTIGDFRNTDHIDPAVVMGHETPGDSS